MQSGIILQAPGRLEQTQLPEVASPGPGQAIVRVLAIGICGTDYSAYLGKMPFIEYPRVLGHELAVEIEELGPQCPSSLQVGAVCSVEPYLNCGQCRTCLSGRSNCCESLQVLGVHCDGGMCQRLCLPAAKLHPAPASLLQQPLGLESVALVETLAIGCHAVERAQLKANESVLIIGAGPIGLTVLEFARLAGANLTVLEKQPHRREFVARHYPQVQLCQSLPPDHRFDVVFDATGYCGSMAASLQRAHFGGRVVWVGITAEAVPLDDALLHRRELSLHASRNARPADFPRILGLMNEGRLQVQPWISERCALRNLPEILPQWLEPQRAVVKAVALVD